MRSILSAAIMLVMFVTMSHAGAPGQHHEHAAQVAAGATSTLSAEAVQQLLNGDGMGLARPAENNRYPGPKHVLELKAELALTAEQLKKVEEIRQQMLEAARPLGRAIVDAEHALDRVFSAGQVTEENLASRLAGIATLQGKLRQVHLHAHLLTRPVLTVAQVRKYYELRAAHH